MTKNTREEEIQKIVERRMKKINYALNSLTQGFNLNELFRIKGEINLIIARKLARMEEFKQFSSINTEKTGNTLPKPLESNTTALKGVSK